ncbi:MAG: hypothetical protein V4599_07400 [Verrucomicrobiota bacterium]
MKNLKGCLIIITVALTVLSIPLIWLWGPQIQGRYEIYRGVRAIYQFKPDQPIASAATYQANTYTHEVSSGTIKEFYQQAVTAILSVAPNAKTYLWEDIMGYPRASIVAEAANGHLEVLAASNNDNDSISISFVPQPFPRPKARLASSHNLPKGLLRCDWPEDNGLPPP